MHGRVEKCTQNFSRKTWKEDHFKELGEDGRILKWNFSNTWRCGMNSSGSRYGPVAGSCEHGNELLGPINGSVLRDQLSFSKRAALHEVILMCGFGHWQTNRIWKLKVCACERARGCVNESVHIILCTCSLHRKGYDFK
jgi:hypothetical protein